MRLIILIIMIIVIVSYAIFMKQARKMAREVDDSKYDTTVASYKPRIKFGQYNVKIETIGNEYKAVIKTINRYRSEAIDDVKNEQVVVENIDIYTAEDLVSELKYIGCLAIIINNQTQIIV